MLKSGPPVIELGVYERSIETRTPRWSIMVVEKGLGGGMAMLSLAWACFIDGRREAAGELADLRRPPDMAGICSAGKPR